MDLRNVLAKLKTENGLTTEQLSQRSGVPKGTLNKLLNGETRNPTGGTLRKIADALNCPVELLYPNSAASGGLDRALRNAEDVLPIHRRAIPLLGEIAAGVPIYADEDTELILCDDTLRCDFALRVRGDSMIKAGIFDGDKVVVRPQPTADDGQIVVARIEDEATVKRLRRRDGQVWLMPENDNYSPINGAHAEIVGLVKAVIREY